MKIIKISSSRREELIDITSQVKALVPSELENGICHLFTFHTTCALTINENADPDVRHDILTFLNDRIPQSYGKFRHFEGNSDAHIKSSLMGFSQTVPVVDGQLQLGTWQGIYLCEFDGARERKVAVQFIGER